MFVRNWIRADEGLWWIRADEGTVLETSVLNLFAVPNLPQMVFAVAIQFTCTNV